MWNAQLIFSTKYMACEITGPEPMTFCMNVLSSTHRAMPPGHKVVTKHVNGRVATLHNFNKVLQKYILLDNELAAPS